MKLRNYKLPLGSKCTYENCLEEATALHRQRKVCALHYALYKKQARLEKLKLKKQEKEGSCEI